MAANGSNSPRQKMINLMYLVFIAMLALNVSSEVLDGFELVEESLQRSSESLDKRNELIFGDMQDFYKNNPEKTEIWYRQAKEVKEKSDSLFSYIQDIKLQIVRRTDAKAMSTSPLKYPDDLNAAGEVLLGSGKTAGADLKKEIDLYREYVSQMVNDTSKSEIIRHNLSTETSAKAKENNKNWEESMFAQMPLAAAVTILTKTQNDIRSAQGEVLSVLLKNIDIGDMRVNQIKAYVIPESQIVMRGGSYSAQIILSAEDSTQKPKVFVNGKILDQEAGGMFKVGTATSGAFAVSGYVETQTGDGTPLRRDFSSPYYVVEPSATIAPTLMNVLYAGYDNPIRIAVPGISSQNVSASMSNGTLTRSGDLWIARPSKIGQEAIIQVSAKMNDSRTQEMAKTSFRVRALPDPLAYLEYQDDNGNPRKFRTGRFAKALLLASDEVKAAIDDDLLRISYSILKFELVIFDSMDNSLREVSDGARFSQRQKDALRKLSKGKTCLITGIVARGPDGVDRTIPSIDITVN